MHQKYYKTRLQWLIALALSIAAMPGWAQSPSLHFKDGIQNTTRSTRTPDPSTIYKDKRYVILQFAETPSRSERQVYEQQGVRFLNAIPDHGYFVSMPAGLDVYNVTSSVVLQSVLPLLPQHKISPTISNGNGNQNGNGKIQIVFAKDISDRDTETILRQHGYATAERPLPGFPMVEITADDAMISEMSAHPAIIWIDMPPAPEEALRYVAVKNERVEALYEAGIGLNGEGVTVGVGDAGKVGDHIDLDYHVTDYCPYEVHFHSTHTSGIVAGRPNLNPLEGQGIATHVDIVTSFFSQIITDADRFINDHHMVITNNSYGSSQGSCTLSGDYNTSSVFIDDQLMEHDTLMHVFSAGNDGGLTCAPYPQRFHTIINGWQSAKNPLVVGMLDHGDVINNASSRGPADDGRLKPEIMAVGTNRRSPEPNNVYAGGSGTSYSAPAIAGISALLYQAYRQEHGVSPDASLIKGLLMNTADDLGQPGPDFAYGYGRVQAKRAYDAMIAERWFSGEADQDDGIEFMLDVPANVAQLRIMLVWKDPSAAPYSAPALVNDLGLVVTDPSATSFNPWVLNPTPAGCTLAAVRNIDDKNPQEQVTITNPVAGTYTLTVHGTDVPFGPQRFYLVYEIMPHELKVVYPNGGESIVPGETEWIRWDASGNAVQTFNVEYSLNNGTNWTTIISNVASNLRRQTWTVPATTTDQLRVRVTAGAFQDVSDTTLLGLRVPTGYTLTTPCRGYAQMTWGVVTGAHHYVIYRLVDGWMQQMDTTSSTSYLIGGLDPAVLEWYSVASVHDSNKQSRRATAKSILASGGLLCTWTNDAGIEALTEPANGRKFTGTALTSNDTIEISVRNAGTNAISNVPVSYQINSSPIQSANISGPLLAGTVTPYAFAALVNLGAPGTYTIKTWVSFPGDVRHANDTVSMVVKHVANNPVTLPITETFESATELDVRANQFGLPGIEAWDYSFSGGKGRVRSNAGTAFIADGERAFTLDALTYNVTSTNAVDMTINLSAYDTATDDIRMSFTYMHHVLISEGDNLNRIWLRGSDTRPWVELFDLSDLSVPRGEHVEISTGLQISNALKENGQNFSSSFQLRFNQQGDASADDHGFEDGYTIDNVHLFEVTNDLQLLSITHPQRLSCGLGVEHIAMRIENTASTALNTISASFQVNNGLVFTEIIPAIPAGDTLIYTFVKSFDFTDDTTYLVSTWVNHISDSYSENDTVSLLVHNSASITAFPYLEDFEEGAGGWYAEGINSTLELGTPSGQFIAKAASGENAWVTNLGGFHNDEEISMLISPCFDVTSLTAPMLSFSHIFQTETNFDFHWVEYSTDGVTWNTLGTTSTGFNWYNNSSPFQSWEGTSDPWHVASIPLPSGQSRLQIRFMFVSDVGVTLEGFGVDDIHIHDRKGVYAGPDLVNQSIPVNGSNWVYFDASNHRILGIHPMGQNLGTTNISTYMNNPDDTADDQAWLLDRNWVVDPTNTPSSPVKVRMFFTADDFDDLLEEAEDIGTGCEDCIQIEDPYQMEGWKYSGVNEDNTLVNNTSGIATYFPDDIVNIVPYDSGYYAEFTVSSLSELWLTGPRISYKDTVLFKVLSSSDDAEEYHLTGSMNPVSPVLDIAETPDSQMVGIRFRNIEIPPDSYIEEAYLQFTAAGDDNAATVMTIRAEDPYSNTSYTTRHFNMSSRIYTTNRQTWNILPWENGESGAEQHSTDLRVLLQELVDHANWLPGRDVAFTLTGNGLRRAWSIDGDPELAPTLYIRYDTECTRDGILYVDAASTGFATGDSWANAFTSLQHALDVANRCPDAKEIWVKAGTYKPSPFTEFDVTSGIKLYGGFEGDETFLAQRNPATHITILSGDLGVIGNTSDNSNHVVHILNGTDTTIVDGFTIRDGYVSVGTNVGAGIFSEGDCILNNLIISNCQAVGGGSAIAHRGTGNVLLISNSVMQNNTGVVFLSQMGGVMRVDEGSVIIEN